MNRFLKRCLQKSEADFWTQNHFKLASVFKRITLFILTRQTFVPISGRVVSSCGLCQWLVKVTSKKFPTASKKTRLPKTGFEQVFKSMTKSSSKLKSCCPTSSVSLFKTFIKTPFLHFFKFNISNFVIHFYHQNVSERETRKWDRREREREHWPWASRREKCRFKKKPGHLFSNFSCVNHFFLAAKFCGIVIKSWGCPRNSSQIFQLLRTYLLFLR